MPRWTVIESPEFAIDLQKLGPKAHSWADTMLGVRWYLERDPFGVGYETQDEEMRILMWDTPDGLPDLKIFYLVEPLTVRLLRAKVDEPLPF
ncbi:MAG: hypothetical protein ICV87_02115 [Gemmatimonadetes bacterium]|nr:hypothetical protein [Gemmatimonadota bacterium]